MSMKAKSKCKRRKLSCSPMKICDKNRDSEQSVMVKNAYTLPSFIKEMLISTAPDHTDDACQILADHCSKILAKVIKSGIAYMNQCGRKKFTEDDFKVGACSHGGQFDDYIEIFRSCLTEAFHLKVDGKWLNYNCSLSKAVCSFETEQQDYFNKITKIVLTENEEVCKIIWKDLKTNTFILYLVPYFVKFLCNCIDKLSSDFLRISLLLKTMHSLLYNPYLYFSSDYLNELTFTLLKFLLKELPHVNENKDCYLLKDSAACLLRIILRKSKSRKLLFDITSTIEDFLSREQENSFISHYGAIATLNSVGVPAILLLETYYNNYIKYLYDNINHFSHTCFDRYNIHMILGQLIHSHYILMEHFCKYEFYYNDWKNMCCFPDFSKSEIFTVLLQLNFKEHFGDSLVHHFFKPDFFSYGINFKKKENNRKKKFKFHLKSNDVYKRRKGTNYKNAFKPDQIFDFVPLKSHKIKFRNIERLNHVLT